MPMQPSASSCYDVDPADVQTYLARFESMRNSVHGKRNRKVFVVHKELERQCRNALRRQEFTSRMNEAELKRQRDSIQERLERIQSEQSRCKKESARNQAELESEAKVHADRRRTLEEEDLATRQRRKTEGGEVETEQLLERIERMAIPNSVKQRLQLHVTAASSAFSSVYIAVEAPTDVAKTEEAGDGSGGGGGQTVVVGAATTQQQEQVTPLTPAL